MQKSTMFVVQAKGTILRAGPELNSSKLRELEGGTVVQVSDEVTLADGKVRCKVVSPMGWVSKKTLSATAPQDVNPMPPPPPEKSSKERIVTKVDGETWLNGLEYARVACELGIPQRPHGIISDQDPLWLTLKNERCFIKHGWDPAKRTFVPAHDSWIVGDQACADRGFDLRYALPKDGSGRLIGLVAFSPKARIMGSASDDIGFQIVHGGAVMSVMDEFMAEHMKATIQPHELTIHFEAQLKRATLPGKTYRLESTCTGKGRYSCTRAFEMRILDPAEQDAVVALAKSEQIDIIDQKFGTYSNPAYET